MGTIRRKNGKFYAEVCRKGKRKGKTHRTKSEAMRWILVTEEEFDTGVIPDKTLGDLLQRYGDTVSPQKKSHQRELNRIGVIQRDPLGRVRLVDLTAPVVAEWRDRKLTQIKPNTIRRDWVLLGS